MRHTQGRNGRIIPLVLGILLSSMFFTTGGVAFDPFSSSPSPSQLRLSDEPYPFYDEDIEEGEDDLLESSGWADYFEGDYEDGLDSGQPSFAKEERRIRVSTLLPGWDWSPELLDETSNQYRRIRRRLIPQMDKLFQSVSGTQDFSIIKISKGKDGAPLIFLELRSSGIADLDALRILLSKKLDEGRVGRIKIRKSGSTWWQPILKDSDAASCDETREFSCSSGECVPAFSRCDGIPDCLDDSDETLCDDEQLDGGPDILIDEDCDNLEETSCSGPDCDERRRKCGVSKPESGCRADTQIACPFSNTRICKIQLCDGEEDCPKVKGSRGPAWDESNCPEGTSDWSQSGNAGGNNDGTSDWSQSGNAGGNNGETSDWSQGSNNGGSTDWSQGDNNGGTPDWSQGGNNGGSTDWSQGGNAGGSTDGTSDWSQGGNNGGGNTDGSSDWSQGGGDNGGSTGTSQAGWTPEDSKPPYPEETGEGAIEPSNAGGSQSGLDFEEEPVLTVMPRALILRYGESLNLSLILSVSALPFKLSYEWLHNGTIEPSMNTRVFYIPAVGYDDSGLYACHVLTEEGRRFISNEASVRVQPPLGNAACSPYFEFTCGDGSCISAGSKCNGLRDCPGGEDESGCWEGGCPLGSHTQCDNGSCVPNFKVCDGLPDCPNGEDETKCSEASSGCDPIQEFACRDNSCISGGLKCNGVADCPGGEDELYCQGKGCPSGYQCGDGACIPDFKVCDGVSDCLGSEDEGNCPNKQACNSAFEFTCSSDGSCIRSEQKCNSVQDCPGGEDERGCSPTGGVCPSGSSFRCGNGDCLPDFKVCDGVVDCVGSEDEGNCPNKPACDPFSEFTCRDGSCIPSSSQCNSFRDCSRGEDEMNCDNSCPPDQRFRCSDGTCIPDFKVCDGRSDCPGAEDEDSFCSSRPECHPSIGFKCNDGNCINKELRCNSIKNCLNGEDEIGCDERAPCPPGYPFQCGDGSCLRDYQVCNGTPDCPGFEDEANCQSKPSCDPSFEYTCGDGSCIDGSLKCNSIPDCPDGTDESECIQSCPLGRSFKCGNGECLPDYKVCDGRPDCPSSEDEANCPNKQACDPYFEFTCGDGSCIRSNLKCNSVQECPGGEDEDGCQGTSCPPGTSFKCGDGSCLPNFKVCDGRADCSDSKDEGNCPNNLVCDPTFEFTCGDGSCISSRLKCNTIENCPDGEDERGCEAESCPLGTNFRCGNGACLPDYKVCDGRSDCNGSEDEINCPPKQACDPYFEFPCNDGTCISSRLKCNSVPNCPNGEDEKDCGGRACPSGTSFRCGDGSCLPDFKVCDGNPDCSGSEDENNCPNKPACNPTWEFQCSDGSCIRSALTCNNVPDCPRGEDEKACPQRVCPPGSKFKCGNGRCLEDERVCDGTPDCPSAEDEANCQKLPACDPYFEFTCGDGNCIDSRLKCNSIPDCPDGKDERDCPNQSCPPDRSFKCGNGDCLPESQVCDGRPDCPSSEDEANCAKLPACDPYFEFTCGDGNCIDSRLKCNSIPDCPDGKDERDCPNQSCPPDRSFKCGNGDCLPESQVCDGRPDCPSSEDEANCPNKQACDPYFEFPCGDGSCIRSNLKCNSFPDCPGGEDENDCQSTGCPPGSSFRCGDGSCLPDFKVCDGRADCYDSKDEENCPSKRVCDPTYEYTCSDGSCISSVLKCNSIPDCPDGGDERGDCDEGSCPPGRSFRCGDEGTCIPDFKVCDGRPDCSRSEDEANCSTQPPGLISRPLIFVHPREQSVLEGQRAFFQCRDDGPARLPVGWRRMDGSGLQPGILIREGSMEIPRASKSHTGIYICSVTLPQQGNESVLSASLHVMSKAVPGGSSGQSPLCLGHEATCSNGQCVPKEALCDGRRDCADGSDESSCGGGPGCEPNEFQCSNKRCVLKTWVCDSDDDCGDGSDESSCGVNPPGSPCQFKEWACKSGNQCIPKSFHCDGEVDCQDSSDEIGCTSPRILESPPPLVKVNVYEPFVINCTAMGIPPPEIVWRLNWGHPPSKCSSVSTADPSTNKAFGEISCPSAVLKDQGAYSCEAINTKGTCFAGSSGCGSPGQDAMVRVIDPNAPPTDGSGICRSGTFNAGAVNPEDCVPCYCSGVSNSCGSAALFKSSIDFGRSDLSSFDVQKSSSDSSVSLTPSSKALSPQEAGFSSVQSNPRSDAHVFVSLSNFVVGSQLKSYGGHLRFNLRYDYPPGRTYFQPDVILMGSNETLFYKFPEGQISPGTTNRVEIPFAPQNWFKGFYGNNLYNPASRNDIMRVLSDVQHLLIRAHYGGGTTEVTDIKLDTAGVRDTGLGPANLVEACQCPQGYEGLSCESCSPGYSKSRGGKDCVPDRPQVENCQEGSYFNNGYCTPCNCPPGPYNRPMGCGLGPDGIMACDCQPGYEGRQCESCSPGYTRMGQSCVQRPTEPQYPPSASIEPQYVDVTEGQPAEFTCRATNGGRISWTKGTYEPLPSGPGGVLRIDNPTLDQNENTYICNVNNPAGSDSAQAILYVRPRASTYRPPPLSTYRPYPPPGPSSLISIENPETYAGSEVRITCKPNNPNSRVSWSKSGGLPPGVDPNSPTLVLPSAQPEDSGAYTCTVLDPYTGGVEEQENFNLEVREPYPGRYPGQGSGQYPGQGSGQYPGQGSGQYPGQGSGQYPGQGSGQYPGQGSGQYPGQGSGQYPGQGSGQYPGGWSAGLVSIYPERQTVEEGSELRITCNASPGSDLQWSKSDGEVIGPSSKYELSGGDLTIRNVDMSDRGVYICSLLPGGNRASVVVDVERVELPVIEIYPEKDQTIVKEGSALFQCRAIKGIPTPEVSWARADGYPLPSNVESLPGGVIRFNQVTGSEAGEYLCTAENPKGKATETVSLQIQEPPSITLNPAGSVQKNKGERFSLSCMAKGDPEPTISLRRIEPGSISYEVGEPISNVRQTNGGIEYNIDSLDRSHEGSYVCKASNAAGDMEEVMQLIVLEDEASYDPNYGRPGYDGNRPGERPGYDPRYPNENQPGYDPRYPEGQQPGSNDPRYPEGPSGSNDPRYPERQQPGSNDPRYPEDPSGSNDPRYNQPGTYDDRYPSENRPEESSGYPSDPRYPGYDPRYPDNRPGQPDPRYPENRPEYDPRYPENRPGYDPRYPENRPDPRYPENQPDPRYPENRPGYDPRYPENRPGYDPRYPESSPGYDPRYPENRPGSNEAPESNRPGYDPRYPENQPGYDPRYPSSNQPDPRYPDNRPGTQNPPGYDPRYPENPSDPRYPENPSDPRYPENRDESSDGRYTTARPQGNRPEYENSPSVYDAPLNRVEASVGDNVLLLCDNPGNQNVESFLWERDDYRPLPLGSYTDNYGVLHLSNAQEDDSGSYTCTGLDPYGNPVLNSKSELSMRGSNAAPSVILSPDYQIVDIGDPAIINCSTANPAARAALDWSREDGSGFQPNIQVTRDGLLRFSDISPENAGIYICRAENYYGSSSGRAEVVVEDGKMTISWLESVLYDEEGSDGSNFNQVSVPEEPPYDPEVDDIVPDESYVFALGEDIVLDCGAGLSGSGIPVWTKDDQPIREKNDVGFNSLYIPGAQFEDAGLYVCEREGETYSIQVHIEDENENEGYEDEEGAVEEEEEGDADYSDAMPGELSSASSDCPPDAFFQCADNGGCIDKQYECDGEFDCTDGSDEKDCGNDGDSPNSDLRIVSNYEDVNPGDSFELECIDEWGRDQDPEWTVDDGFFDTNVFQQGHVLKFLYYDPENAGVYTCSIGDDTASYRLE